MTKVYFATNRAQDPNAKLGFGANVVPNDNSKITFAVATVEFPIAPSGKIDLRDESAGIIKSIDDLTPRNFSQAATNEIVSSGKNLLVFVHGFDNSFEDAIKRAAYNREWFAQSGIKAADTTVLAFTWPSAGTLFAAPPHMPPDAYLNDQTQAGRSGWHVAYFLEVIAQLRRNYRAANPNGRIVLLAHSMGNYALQAGIQTWSLSREPDETLFDEVVLAAADEIDDSFERPAGGRLSDLPALTPRISIYHSRRDVAMYLSTTVNLSWRIGFDGPADKYDGRRYSPDKFRVLDCTEVLDYDLLNPPDASHQYYRRSQRVRTDIASVFVGEKLSTGITSL
jgi:esterase/lipase superfamily enzyme